jgi:hypothetical protein
MQWEIWEPSPRDILIDRVRRGEITPEEAEQEAENRGFGQLATKPDSVEFEPDEMPWWSLPMAVAWIAWRNSKSVREHCTEFREKWLHWVPGSWNVPINNGTDFTRIDGYELKELGKPTVCRLSLVDAYLTSTETLPPTTQMTVAKAEKQLFAALAAGQITAIAKDATGQVVQIPQREWPYLQLFEEAEADVLKHDALDHTPTFSEIKLPRERLKQVWQEFLVEPYMIEPMMRSGTAGYVPLCSALHWIITEAGRKSRQLEDTQLWDAAVGRLFPLISTGEVQVIGTDASGVPAALDGVIFAGISVGRPLRDCFHLIAGDKPWISCTPYVDEQHWESDFNDCMYLKRSGPPSWTHLRVRKADVLRHIAFESDASETANGLVAVPEKSGGQSFAAEDAALVEEMRALIKAGKAKNASAAAIAVVSKAKKLGSDDSAVERLRRAYGRKYPTRKRL